MSTQELRDRLQQELAELSDNDEDLDALDSEYLYGTDTYGTDSYGTADSEGVLLGGQIECGDDKVHLDDIEEWQQLMRSAVTIEERFQGFKISLADDFETLVDEGTVAETPIAEGHLLEVDADSMIVPDRDVSVNAAASSSLGSLNIDGIENNSLDVNQDKQSVEVEIDEEQEWVDTLEIQELLNYIIEAVERSAPIIVIPIIEARQLVVDWSLLPQMIGDDDDTIPQALTSRIENDMNPSINENDTELLWSLQRQQILKDSADTLALEAAVAEQHAVDRKKQLLERRRMIDDELRAVRRDNASVRIQSKWRQIQQKRQYAKRLESHKIQIGIEVEAEERSREAKRIEECRLQIEEDRKTEERKRIDLIEEKRREKKELEEMEEIVRQRAVELERIEVERERRESANMFAAGSFSRQSWEYEEELRAIQEKEEKDCVICKVCCAVIKKKKRIRKIKKRNSKKFRLSKKHSNDTEELFTATPVIMSAQDILEREENVKSLEKYWALKALGSIDDSAGKEFLHGTCGVKREDLLRLLRVEIEGMQSEGGVNDDDNKGEMGGMDGKGMRGGKGMRDEKSVLRGDSSGEKSGERSGVRYLSSSGSGGNQQLGEGDGPLLQAMRCWQHWSTTSGLTVRSDQLKSLRSTETSEMNQPNNNNQNNNQNNNENDNQNNQKGQITPLSPLSQLSTLSPLLPLIEEESTQLSSFGLRAQAVSNSDSDTNYREISLGVESLTSCSFLRTFTSLRRLLLNVNKLRTLSGLEGMSYLEELSIKDNAICSLDMIRNLKGLRSLSADDNNLNADGIGVLSNLQNLHTLSANTNKLHTFPFLSGCHGLQRLYLYHNSISLVSTSSLTPLCSLIHLDLGRNKLESISGAALSQCPLLQTLVLSQNLLTTPPSPLYLPNLRNLWLSGNRLQDLCSWMPYRDNTKKNPTVDGQNPENPLNTLKTLNNLKTINALIWPIFLPMLEKLHLSDNSLSDISASAFCTMPLLSDLDISFNNITTTSGLEGLRHLPKLSALQLHDNPVYSTSSVGGVNSVSGSGGSSGGGVSELTQWLTAGCPSLRIVSGTVLVRKDAATPITPIAAATSAGGGNGGAAAVRNQSTGGGTGGTAGVDADGTLGQIRSGSNGASNISAAAAQTPEYTARCREAILEQFRRTAKWSSPSSIDLSLRSQLRIKESSYIKQGLECRDRDGAIIPCAYNNSELSRQLIQTLLTLSFDQNVLKAREKVENIRVKYPPNVCVSTPTEAKEGEAEGERIYWETAMAQQLEKHTNILMNWSKDSIMSDLPIVRMQRVRMPVEEEYDRPQPRVVWNSPTGADAINATRGGGVNTPFGASFNAPGGSSGVSFGAPGVSFGVTSRAYGALGSSIPVSVPPGLVRLQAVWRSRNVRSKVRSLLLASRYQDDELDEMLGEDFNLEDLGEGYDDYLAPVKWQGGTQGGNGGIGGSSSSGAMSQGQGDHNNIGNSNYYGEKGEVERKGSGGKGDYGGYDNGGDGGDGESSSLASQGGALVYGDHRRRKAGQGQREDHYYPRHVLCDGRNDRPAAYSQAPNLSYTQTVPLEWPARPSSSVSETSTLSGASSRGHSVGESQGDSPRGNNGYDRDRGDGGGGGRGGRGNGGGRGGSDRDNRGDRGESDRDNRGGRGGSDRDNRGGRGGSDRDNRGDRGDRDNNYNTGIADSPHPSQPTNPSNKTHRGGENSETVEWGISDPKVLQAMLKRNKRMKGFAAARDAREKEKDPDVRLQRFTNNTSKTQPQTTMSWGGGGAAGVSVSTGSGRGRGRMGGGGKGKRNAMPPAWAMGAAEGDEDEG